MIFFKINPSAIVTESDMEMAFLITHGYPASQNRQEYNDWVNSSAVSIDEILYADQVTIEELAHGNCIGPAVKKYIQKYGGGLKEAKAAIDKIRDEVQQETVPDINESAESVQSDDEDLSNVNRIVVTNIDWDTDDDEDDDDGTENEGETRHLPPKEITIEINDDNRHLLEDLNGYADNLLDYLSDTYGFCIRGFNAETETE